MVWEPSWDNMAHTSKEKQNRMRNADRRGRWWQHEIQASQRTQPSGASMPGVNIHGSHHRQHTGLSRPSASLDSPQEWQEKETRWDCWTPKARADPGSIALHTCGPLRHAARYLTQMLLPRDSQWEAGRFLWRHYFGVRCWIIRGRRWGWGGMCNSNNKAKWAFLSSHHDW